MLSRYLKTHLLGLILVTGLLASCNSCNGGPPQLGEIKVSPDKVQVNKTAILTVAASGRSDLKFKWAAQRGTVSNSTGSSTTYTAPATDGVDTVTVTATDSGGSASKGVNVLVEKVGGAMELTRDQFIPNPADRHRELIADVSAGLLGLLPQDGQEGIDLRGYKLVISLQGKASNTAQLFFKDCKDKNSYRADLPVGLDLSYDPARDPKAVNENPDFSHICIIGVKVFPNLQGISLVSAKLVRQ